MTSTERRRETPYESHELHTLATLAVSQSYLAVVAGLLLQFVTELGLRQNPGFADDTIQDAAIRYVGGAAAGLLCYGLSYVIPKRVRRPFLEATLLMLAVSALMARAGHHVGGASGPYCVSMCTILFCWSLIMPGGARYAAFPVLGGLVTFYLVLFLSGGRGFFEIRATAFFLFTATSSGFALVYAEVLERWRRRVSLAITTDPLTQVLSRAYALERLWALLARSETQKQALAVLMVDVDHFKSVNDRYGHAMGDEVLRGVANALASAIRRQDVCGRLGGEEFLLVLPNCDLDAAREIAERVRRQVAACQFAAQGVDFGVTVSIGVSQVKDLRVPAESSPTQKADALLREADRALYASKSAGRDRVTVATP